MQYHPNQIEPKWQDFWRENNTFKAENESDKPKYYVLDMFPYPSGAGLHVGHPLGYIASDIYARYKRHKGFNVLHPMGYDSFGLPAEQYAIQTGQHPAVTTKENIVRYREQLDKIGFSFDWNREVRTSDPDYYKWTQWIFIQLFNSYYCNDTQQARPIDELIEVFDIEGNININAATSQSEKFGFDEWRNFSEKQKSEILLNYRLTYLAEAEVNWCAALGTVLANDEVVNGVSERGGHPVERKKMTQWMMRITAYAERLLNGISYNESALDWSEALKESQKNWIGKSKGASVKFPIQKGPVVERSGEFEAVVERSRDIVNETARADVERSRDTAVENTDEMLKQVQHDKDDDNTGALIEGSRDIANETARAVVERSRDTADNKNDEMLKQVQYDKGKEDLGGEIEVFTTRPDTIFGASFMVLAPEHELVTQISTPDRKEAVENYIAETAKRSERERMAEVKKITGVFTGAYAEHPFTGEPIPIWIADYVLAGYGTGAVMAVPAGDERDYAFANHFGLPVPDIFEGIDISEEAYSDKEGTAKLQNSDFLNGLTVKEALPKAIAALEEKKIGKGQVNYRLRDAVFSRQRYWGEPVPVYFKNGIPTPVPVECLPLELPEIDEYLPTETGEPPLGRATHWSWDEKNQKVVTNELVSEEIKPEKNDLVKCNLQNAKDNDAHVYPLELNTMPGWAGSSWYLFRYMDPKNDAEFASEKALNYWKNVDLYIGGSEHATGHLLYSRFWTKFLKDRGYMTVDEPFKKLINQGMILGESAFVHRVKDENKMVSAGIRANRETVPLHVDVNMVESDQSVNIDEIRNWREDLSQLEFETENGKFFVTREVEKMSKSKYNVVNPDDICDEFGADTLRMYEMFLGPIEQSKPWNTNGLSGVFGFLKKFYKLFSDGNEFSVSDEEPTKEEFKILHTLIKKVTEDIENFSFNTSVSAFMIAVNDLQKLKSSKRAILEPMTVLISPFAPHIAEELWSQLGHEGSVSQVPYPEFDEKYLAEDTKAYPVSFNGKMRFTLELPMDMSKEEIEKAVMADERTEKYLEGRTPKKVIIVPGKIVNLVG